MGKIFWGIIVFLVIGGLLITNAFNYDLNETDDQKSFVKKYFSWIFQVGGNIKDITGEVVKKDWLPETDNSTNTTIVIIDE